VPARLAALLRPHTLRERFAFVQREDGWRLLLIVDNRTREERPVSTVAAEAILRSHVGGSLEDQDPN
jgi:hypothetical protein